MEIHFFLAALQQFKVGQIVPHIYFKFRRVFPPTKMAPKTLEASILLACLGQPGFHQSEKKKQTNKKNKTKQDHKGQKGILFCRNVGKIVL